MPYSLNTITQNGFTCDWTTLYVGKKFGFITANEISKFAMEYLNDHVDVDDANIIELAWALSEEKVEEALQMLIIGHNSEVIKKEYHKWRYCVLKEIGLKCTKDELFRGIEGVFSLLECPEDMYDFFRRVSDTYYYPSKESESIVELLKYFLIEERSIF